MLFCQNSGNLTRILKRPDHWYYRPEYYGINQDENGEATAGKAQIIFAKGRNIGVGTVTLNFISELTKFKDNSLDF